MMLATTPESPGMPAKDNIVNYGVNNSSKWDRRDFIVRWTFEFAYRNSRTTWMVGSGSKKKGARFDLFQDSNNNRRFDDSDSFTGTGSVSRQTYSAFTNILKGRRGEVLGYGDFTADVVYRNQTVGQIDWF
jgi:hypothetical protein